jgi:glycosyltransferase involved in cell wall biosynthesis
VDYNRNRVVFYARHQTRRRGTELGLLSLAMLKRSRPETEVVIFGSDDLPYRLPFEHTPAGILSKPELAELYRGAAVGLSISLTNYSLVPQEMLACGLPVVEMDLPSMRAAYARGGDALRLAAPNPSAIAAALSEATALSDAAARRARGGRGTRRPPLVGACGAGAARLFRSARRARRLTPGARARPPETRRPRPSRNLYCIFPARVLFLAPSANTT